MRPRIANILAAASGACAVLLIVLWAASFRVEHHACRVKYLVQRLTDQPRWSVIWGAGTVGVTSTRGQLLFGTRHTTRDPLATPDECVLIRRTHWSVGDGGGHSWAGPFNNRPSVRSVSFCGIGFIRSEDRVGETTPMRQARAAVVVPHWLAVLLTSLLPARSLWVSWRRRRRGGRGFDVSIA